MKFSNLKKNNLANKNLENKIKDKSKKTNFDNNIFNKINKINRSNVVNIDFINEIKNNEKFIERIKYLQLWWKTIFQIIKMQKYIRGFLRRVKLLKIFTIELKINSGISLLSQTIKHFIYNLLKENIKTFCKRKIKLESPRKKFSKMKNNKPMEFRKSNNNNINNINNDHLSFEKIFMTSRKLKQKQKPKIKNNKLNFNTNTKISQQRNLTKQKNSNNAKINPENESIKITQDIPTNKVCQFFNTSSNFNINKKNLNNNNNININTKTNKAEISHKVGHKTKKLIKYRNEINNNMNKFKSYRPESYQNKSDKKNLVNNNTIDSSNIKQKLELEYISTHQSRFYCPKKLFELNNDKSNNKNIIRVQKKIFKNKNNINNIEKESAINLRSRSLENRTNQNIKEFSNKKDKNKKNYKNNKSGSTGKNISGFIQNNKYFDNKTIIQYRNNNNNNCKQDMIKWLNSWEKKNINNNININKSLNANNSKNIKNISFLIDKIISYNNKNNGNFFFNYLKYRMCRNMLKNNFKQYKYIVEKKIILEKLKRVQQNKIYEQNIEKEKLNKLKNLLKKYNTLKKSLVKWKIFIYQYNKFYEEKNIIFSTSDVSNINEDLNDSNNDYFNKSQPEIDSLKINNFNFIKNKYNISKMNSSQKDRNNNINININYNLITNNNSIEQRIYKKKKINVPKTKNYQNNSCFIGEYAQDINSDNTINEQKDLMNNSMIIRRIKIKKKEIINNIYFPKHVKPNHIQNDFDYITYKNIMQFSNNKNDEMRYKGVIHKKINLKFQKISEMKNNF